MTNHALLLRSNSQNAVIVDDRAAAAIAVARREIHAAVGGDEDVAEAAVLSLEQRLFRGHALSIGRQRQSVECCALERCEEQAALPLRNEVGQVEVGAGRSDGGSPRRERLDDVVRLTELTLASDVVVARAVDARACNS